MKIKESRYCKCGCGNLVTTGKSRKMKWIKGHNPGQQGPENERDQFDDILEIIDESNWYEAVESEEPGGRQMFLVSDAKSPEEHVIKDSLFKNLSEEAQYVISICLNTPAELVNTLLTPVTKVVSLKAVEKLLTKKWNSRKARVVLHELSDFVETF